MPFINGAYLGGEWHGYAYHAGEHRNYTLFLFPLQESGYKIVFYDRSGQKMGEVSSELGDSALVSADFALENIGCADFAIELAELPTALAALTYNWRVDIHLFGDSEPWYSGYVIELPRPGTTERAVKFSGYGFYNQLGDRMVDGDYQATTVEYIVNHLLQTQIEAGTDIVYNADKIEATGHTIQRIRWEKVYAREVMKQLAEMVLGYEYGVDARREFFFRQKPTTVQDAAHLWVGANLNTFIPTEDINKVRNRLHVFGGAVTGQDGSKTNFVATVEDVASQGAYGIKEEKLTLPSSLGSADATRWGGYKLTELKDPVRKAKVTGIELRRVRIEARGLARITSLDGLHEYELPIKKVKYAISSDGVVADVDLGEKDIAFAEEQLRLKQQLITADQLQAERTRQS